MLFPNAPYLKPTTSHTSCYTIPKISLYHYHAPASLSNRDSSFCASSTSFFAFMRI